MEIKLHMQEYLQQYHRTVIMPAYYNKTTDTNSFHRAYVQSLVYREIVEWLFPEHAFSFGKIVPLETVATDVMLCIKLEPNWAILNGGFGAALQQDAAEHGCRVGVESCSKNGSFTYWLTITRDVAHVFAHDDVACPIVLGADVTL